MKWVTPSQDGPRNHNAKFRCAIFASFSRPHRPGSMLVTMWPYAEDQLCQSDAEEV